MNQATALGLPGMYKWGLEGCTLRGCNCRSTPFRPSNTVPIGLPRSWRCFAQTPIRTAQTLNNVNPAALAEGTGPARRMHPRCRLLGRGRQPARLVLGHPRARFSLESFFQAPGPSTAHFQRLTTSGTPYPSRMIWIAGERCRGLKIMLLGHPGWVRPQLNGREATAPKYGSAQRHPPGSRTGDRTARG